MCGIFGVINYAGGPVSREVLSRATDSLYHRGPDDRGFFMEKNIALGMRRLSIIDVKGGGQPVHNEDNSIWIVYNGEIYNFPELMDDLKRKGHSFYTKTDTEVILHLYETYGENCVKYLNGMFAFAIYDKKNNRMFFARDRMGIKPLYYYQDKDKFVFSSEIKAIFEVPDVEKKIDIHGLYDYLSFRYVPAPGSIFEKISKLLPGYAIMLDINSGKTVIKQYWDMGSYVTEGKKQNEDYYAEKFNWLLTDAVRKRLISDVPLGTFLSGGLDSSAITAIMAESAAERIKTFSVAFDSGGIYSELNYVRKVTDYLGVEKHEIIIGEKEFVDLLSDFLEYTGEPLADPTCIPLYYVARLAREKVTVVLSGEGADELLAGYDFEKWKRRMNRASIFLELPGLLRKKIPGLILKIMRLEKYRQKLERLNLPLESFASARAITMTDVFSAEEKDGILANKPDCGDSLDIIKDLYSRVRGADALKQMLYVYCKSWLPDDLLMKADRMTMANSLELRVPFLDHRIVEFLAGVPSEFMVRMKSGRWQTKYLLRKIMKQRLPEEILNRGKLGFPVPAYQWLSGSLKKFAYDILLSGDVSGFFLKKEVEALLRKGTQPAAGPAARAKVWLLLVFELWYGRVYKKYA